MDSLKIEFDKYIRERFPGSSGAAPSYYRAVNCVLDYLGVDTFEKGLARIDDIREFANSPKNMQSFLTIYPNFKIGTSYIEKGWITAGIKHFELFMEIKIKQQLGFDETVKSIVGQYSEDELEYILNFRDNAKIKIVSKEVKERILDRSIITSLKKFYNYRCQICEKKFTDPYNVDICEGHHIEHFIKSLDNNPDNIIVLCPNHHRVMHAAKPVLDRGEFQFLYDGGYREKIKLIDHFSKVAN